MQFIKQLFDRREMFYYILIGFAATAVDWIVYSIGIAYFHLAYQIALPIAYATAGIAHYVANKLLTFQCQSRKIGSQLSTYFFVALISFSCTMGIMTLLIKLNLVGEIWARILTTGIMILPNYLLHKNVTFSKKLFV